MNTVENTVAAVSPRPLALNLFHAYPALQGRIEKAVELYKAGAVELDDSGLIFYVYGSQAMPYTVDASLTFCNCPDHEKAPYQVCKHQICSGLVLASTELAKNKMPTLLKVLRTRSRALK